MNAPDPSLFAPRRTPMDVAGWVRYFQLAEIPVLSSTAAAIEDMRENEDAVDARMLADVISADPLMTLKLLAYTAQLQRSRRQTDIETVTEAFVLIGITPFFRDFGPQPTIEQHLDGQPEALQGLRDVVQRAHRAAKFALSFAVHRFDRDASVIHEAALLHDFAELLLWCHAPVLAMELSRLQRRDPTLRSVTAQRAVLGVALADLQLALMRTWRLHDLLVKTADERHAEHPSVKTVALAVRLARHSAHGWDDAALGDDFSEAANLLNLSLVATRQLVDDIGV